MSSDDEMEYIEYMVQFDRENGFPDTDPTDVIDWRHFNADFFSTEQVVDQQVFDNL